MLLTIHNLPSTTRYVDVKSMLQEKCGLDELILDNLVPEGKTKKVTVGLADEGDAAILVRKINGLYVNGLQLYVEDKRKKKESDQPYRSSASFSQEARHQQHIPPGAALAPSGAAVMNYNEAGMYRPVPEMPMDQNMPYVGYGGGFKAAPPVEPPSAPARADRGPARFQGEGGAGARPRDLPRDAARPRDRPRRPEPDRPADSFTRPSRWNEPKQVDGPPRREPSPSRQPWAPREPNPAPRPSLPPPLPERAPPRDFEPFPARPQPPQQRRAEPEYRRAEPRWEPRPSRWDDDRDPQMRERQWSEPEPRWEPEPDRGWQPEPELARDWRPEPEPDRGWQSEPEPVRGWQPEPGPVRGWQPEPEADRGWQPEPEADRGWQPEPEPDRSWQPQANRADVRRDEPYHAMEDGDNRRLGPWDAGFPPGPAAEYLRPDRFEPHDRRFDDSYPPVHHNEPDFHRRDDDQLDDRAERRPRRDVDWNAGNERMNEKRATVGSSRNEQPWARREDRPRPAHPSRHGQDDQRPKPSSANSRNGNDWREDKRPNSSKRDLSERQRGPQDWNQIANDYPPFKKPKGDFDKRAVEPRRNNFAPKENDSHRRVPTQKAPERPQRFPPAQNTLSNINQKPITMTHMINKDQTSRGQATAKLAKEANFVHGTMRDVPHVVNGVLKELKQCIRSRIDVMLGEELLDSYEEIIKRYRLKYPVRNDRGLYQCMKDKFTQRFEQEKGREANLAAVKTEKCETQGKVKVQDNKPVKTTGNKDDQVLKDKATLPKHVLTGKQFLREEKLQRKLEYTKEDHYKLDPITNKIVDEELDKFTNIFASECEDPGDATEQAICDRITKEAVDEFKQVTRIHLAKRILNIRTGLAIRIFSNGKLPRRASVAEYLKPYLNEGLNLKKNKKGTMYVANIASFEHYDHLCHLQNDVIDGTPVSIKSMYLVGPSEKLSKSQIKMKRQQFINSQIEPRDSLIVPTESKIEPTESQIEPTESGIEPTKSQIELNQSQIEPTESQIEPTESRIEPTESQSELTEIQIKPTESQIELKSLKTEIEQTHDPMNNINADKMEDFTADDFSGGDFASDDFGTENFAAEHSAGDSNIADPVELNIADIKEEDLEDF